MESLALESEIAQAEAIVLTGGEDIHPGRYGQPDDTVRCGRIDVERDRVEHQLLDAVRAQGLPCLGVCRGLQVMNVHGGGTLHPHLPDAGHEGHRGGQPGDTRDTLHPVEVSLPWASGSVSWTLTESALVVSHHHQGIAELAEGFEPWAVAPDGLVEGIRWTDTASVSYLVGVQYHPERSRKGLLLTDGLGVGLLQAASKGD
jgi:putative glutamine amidotransferase